MSFTRRDECAAEKGRTTGMDVCGAIGGGPFDGLQGLGRPVDWVPAILSPSAPVAAVFFLSAQLLGPFLFLHVFASLLDARGADDVYVLLPDGYANFSIPERCKEVC